MHQPAHIIHIGLYTTIEHKWNKKFLNLHNYTWGLNSRKLDTQKPHRSVLCVHTQRALFCTHRFQLPRQPCLEDFKRGFNIWRLLCLSTVKKQDYRLEKHSTFLWCPVTYCTISLPLHLEATYNQKKTTVNPVTHCPQVMHSYISWQTVTRDKSFA